MCVRQGEEKGEGRIGTEVERTRLLHNPADLSPAYIPSEMVRAWAPSCPKMAAASAERREAPPSPGAARVKRGAKQSEARPGGQRARFTACRIDLKSDGRVPRVAVAALCLRSRGVPSVCTCSKTRFPRPLHILLPVTSVLEV